MIDHLLDTELTVWRPTATLDDVGGQDVTYANVGTVLASVTQPAPGERTIGDRWAGDLGQVVYLSASADVRRGDELEGDLPTPTGGRRIRVEAVTRNSRASYTRCDCELLQPEGA